MCNQVASPFFVQAGIACTAIGAYQDFQCIPGIVGGSNRCVGGSGHLEREKGRVNPCKCCIRQSQVVLLANRRIIEVIDHNAVITCFAHTGYFLPADAIVGVYNIPARWWKNRSFKTFCYRGHRVIELKVYSKGIVDGVLITGVIGV